jgi:hypothetical protein
MTTPALFHAAAADSRGKLRVSADRRSVFSAAQLFPPCRIAGRP